MKTGKTGKIGAIFLISIMALAGIGAGYAMWSDTVTIHGAIATGTVKVGIYDVSTDDPGPNYLDGGLLYPDGKNPGETRTLNVNDHGTWDLWTEPGHNEEGKNIASHDSENLGESVCTKKIDGRDIVFYDQITETIKNAYPWYKTGTTVWISNCGTIPVKINSVKHTNIDGTAPEILNYIDIDFWQLREYDDVTGWTIGAYGNDAVTLTAAMLGYQLEPCHTLEMDIEFHFIEEIGEGDDTVLMPQGGSVTFDVIVELVQWNEYPHS